MATDLSTVSNADLSAALQARELAAVQPLVAALTAMGTAAQTAQTALAGITNTRAAQAVQNILSMSGSYLAEVEALVTLLTPPAK